MRLELVCSASGIWHDSHAHSRYGPDQKLYVTCNFFEDHRLLKHSAFGFIFYRVTSVLLILMSSLAAQLAKNASLNASLLVDRSRRKPTTSYLFTGKDADQHDLEAIHALGVNSLLELCSVNPKLRKFEDSLFSEHAKETDRTLLTSEAVEELDEAIEEFLFFLGPYLMEPPTSKILEWLVRRFR